MTAGNQPSSSVSKSAFDICVMIVEEECYLDAPPAEGDNYERAIHEVGLAIRDRLRCAQQEAGGGAQPPRGRDHFIAEAIAESVVTPSPGARAWTPDQFWEYVGVMAGEFEAGQMRDMLAARWLSITSTDQQCPECEANGLCGDLHQVGRWGVNESERTIKDRLADIYAWMREPDYTEEASLEWLMDWVNRRPVADLAMVAMLMPDTSEIPPAKSGGAA